MDFARVGQYIRKVRQERRMRLDDLADEVIPRATLSAIERGLTHNETKVRYVLRKLDVSLADLSEKEKEAEEKRELDLLLIEQQMDTDPAKALKLLAKLPTGYHGPYFDYLKGLGYYKLKKYDQAEPQFEQVIKKLELLPDLAQTNLASCAYNHLSIINYYRKNKEKALCYVNEGIHLFDLQSGVRKPYYVTLLVNKAIYLRSMGQAEKAIATLEKIEVDTIDVNIDAALSLYEIQAKLKKEIKLYDEAITFAKKGLYLAIVNHTHERQLALLITLGDIYKEKNKLNEAKKCLEAAIKLKEQITRRDWLLLHAYLELGDVYFRQQRLQEAQSTFQHAAKIAKSENNMLKYAQALLSLGKTLISEGNYEDAHKYFLEVYKLNIKENDITAQSLYHLSRTSLMIGDQANYQVYSQQYFNLEALGR
ncbi:helix-turn-helix domain-containing protein [Laceyella putida]|uniref:Helix-turn-helix domain-containing protein n=1 Tax=Laceyella putida TaxID=110101 RepID=A0ABW2RJN6_9BACL